MNEFCGWFGRFGDKVRPEAVLDGMARWLSIDKSTVPTIHAADNAGLAVRGRANPGINTSDDSIWAVCEGQPNWNDQKLAQTARDHGHAAALIEAYRQHGKDCLTHLHGPFSCAVLDHVNRRVLLAIDRVGIHSLCFAPIGTDGIVFGTNTDSVRSHPGVGATITPQAIFSFLNFYRSPAPQTIYAEQSKLRAGEYLLFEVGRGLQTGFYHSMQYSDDNPKSLPELGTELIEHLRSSVSDCVAGHSAESLGSFLSGGLDSSTVTGLYSEATNAARSFTICFENERYNEAEYARLAASRFNTQHHEYTVTHQDVFDSVEMMAAAYDEPFANSSALPTYFCAKLASDHGVSTMLAGDGGDEIFAGNERYVEQEFFNAYFRIPKFLRRWMVEPLTLVPPWPNALTPATKLRNYIQKANTPLPDRLTSANLYAKLPLNDLFEPGWADSINPDEPLEILRETYRRPENASELQRMMHLDIQFTLADGDLRKVNRMCELAGVDVRYPFLSDQVVEYSAAVPSNILIKNSELRWFYKYAMKDFLPDEILTKKKHGFGVPYVDAINEFGPLRELTHDCAARFRERHILNTKFLDRVRNSHHENRSRQSADILWDIMILELWYEHHVDKAQTDADKLRHAV